MKQSVQQEATDIAIRESRELWIASVKLLRIRDGLNDVKCGEIWLQ